jgi:hypothetical protein
LNILARIKDGVARQCGQQRPQRFATRQHRANVRKRSLTAEVVEVACVRAERDDVLAALQSAVAGVLCLAEGVAEAAKPSRSLRHGRLRRPARVFAAGGSPPILGESTDSPAVVGFAPTANPRTGSARVP